MESSAALPGVLSRISGFFQDLERSDGGRKHRHVASSRTDDFPDGSARGYLHTLAAERVASQSAGGRFCDRKQPKRARSRRITSFNLSAWLGAEEKLCVPPIHSNPFRTLRGPANRHPLPGKRAISPDRHTLPATARPTAFSETALRRKSGEPLERSCH